MEKTRILVKEKNKYHYHRVGLQLMSSGPMYPKASFVLREEISSSNLIIIDSRRIEISSDGGLPGVVREAESKLKGEHLAILSGFEADGRDYDPFKVGMPDGLTAYMNFALMRDHSKE